MCGRTGSGVRGHRGRSPRPTGSAHAPVLHLCSGGPRPSDAFFWRRNEDPVTERRSAVGWGSPWVHKEEHGGSPCVKCVSTCVQSSVRLCEHAACAVPVSVSCLASESVSPTERALHWPPAWLFGGRWSRVLGARWGGGCQRRRGHTAPCFCSRLPALPSALSGCQWAEAVGSSRGSAGTSAPPAPPLQPQDREGRCSGRLCVKPVLRPDVPKKVGGMSTCPQPLVPGWDTQKTCITLVLSKATTHWPLKNYLWTQEKFLSCKGSKEPRSGVWPGLVFAPRPLQASHLFCTWRPTTRAPQWTPRAPGPLLGSAVGSPGGRGPEGRAVSGCALRFPDRVVG